MRHHRTGYKYIRETSAAIFGADVIDRTSEVWGLDAEGELSGAYRPSGHPGVSTPASYMQHYSQNSFSSGSPLEISSIQDTCPNIWYVEHYARLKTIGS